MEFAAVKPGQGVPRERPLRGLLQAVAVLVATLAITLGALHWRTSDRLEHRVVDRARFDMASLLACTLPTLRSQGDNFPMRLLSDPTRTMKLPPGATPTDLQDLLRARATERSASERAPTRDPWNGSYILEAKRVGEVVRLTCLCAGPNGVFETAAEDAAANGDDLIAHRDG